VLLTDDQLLWVWSIVGAGSLKGLNCSPSDVMRLALDEMRERYPSPRGLEAALREHVWRELGTNPGRALQRPPRAVRLPVPPGSAGRRREPGSVIKVLLVEDDPAVRADVAAALATADDVWVVAELDGGEAALGHLARDQVNLVLIGLSLPGMDGVQATRAIAAAHPNVRVVALVSDAERGSVLDAVDAGAVGYVLRDADPEELVRAVRATARGESSPALRAVLALLAERAQRSLPESPLTERECQVLRLVGKGLANKQIAIRLGISEKTVKTHLGSVFQRIGVRDRTQAALWAAKRGLLDKA
jgi:DNA-binding NarL/FixJ family response regulator